MQNQAQSEFRDAAIRVSTQKAEPGTSIDVFDEFRDLLESIHGDKSPLFQPVSARERIIVVTSLLDQLLKLILLTKLSSSLGRGRMPTASEMREVFEGKGPLSGFGDRITAASALGMLAPDMRNDLKIMKGLRNDFAAHSYKPLSFDDADVVLKCQSLKVKMKAGPSPGMGVAETRFISSAAAMLAGMMFVVRLLGEQNKVLSKHADEIIRVATEDWKTAFLSKKGQSAPTQQSETPEESPSSTPPRPAPE